MTFETDGATITVQQNSEHGMNKRFVVMSIVSSLMLAGCSGDGGTNAVINATNMVAAPANVIETNNTAAAVDPRDAYAALADCTALMIVSARLTRELAGSTEGSAGTQMVMQATLRDGRAGALRAHAVSAGGDIDMLMAAVNEDIAGRERRVTAERGSASLADFTAAINARADTCYERVG